MMANLDFDMPQNQASSIKVIGVGGGGSNAVNYMYEKGIRGVDFVVCNTDQQALDDSPVPNKIQLGVSVTEGLGAGADPLRGKFAAEENIEDVIAVLECNTKMVFINAGMGGGTGTGAAPVIAKAAKDMDILTVAIVTIPFVFEGELRMSQAKEGIEELKQHVDSLIVINNNKLREIYGNLGFKSGFAKADEILATASRGIAEVITQKGHLNIDLNDAKTVLSNSGTAIMGSGTASGDGRALKAVKGAIESPLLDNNHIRGAKKVLLLIVSGAEEVTFEEMGEISDFIQDQVMIEGGSPADIIMGVAEDEELESAVNVTVVATGFHEGKVVNPLTGIPVQIVHDLDDKVQAKKTIEEPLSIAISVPAQEEKVIESAVEVKHILTEDDVEIEEELVEFVPESIVQDLGEIEKVEPSIFDLSEPEQQVSMTFEFDVEESLEKVSIPKREEPKVVFNLLEEIEEERVEIEAINDVEEALASEEIQEETSFELENFEESLEELISVELNDVEEELVSFELETTQEDVVGESAISFSLDEPVTSKDAEHKIVHTLSLDDEEEESLGFEPASFDVEEPVLTTRDNVVNKAPTFSTESIADKVVHSLDVESAPDVVVDVKEEVLDDEVHVESVEKPILAEVKTNVTLSTHSDTVKEQIDRAQKRKERLQKFNYRFRNNSVIDKAEREPAYKRQGVQLNDTVHSSEQTLSRVSLSTNEEGTIELKSKNSFLHDNVD
jgi:cell division protein FtsZ